MHTVFTYGSLLSGLHNHDVLDPNRSTFLGSAELLGSYRMQDFGQFPAAYEHADGCTILGEAYDVDDDQLARLDRLEGNGRFYQREERTIVTDDGSELTAWVYFIMHVRDGYRELANEPLDWREHLDARELAGGCQFHEAG